MVSELTVNPITVSAAPGETVRFRHDFDRESNEYDTRPIYLLYTEEPPANPIAGNAYRTVHIWVG
jgi:hypothetical protein